MMNVYEMKGLGPATCERLWAVGIKTSDHLDEVGAVGAYRLLMESFPEWVTLNAMWGIQAALMEIDWRDLPDEMKERLLDELGE